MKKLLLALCLMLALLVGVAAAENTPYSPGTYLQDKDFPPTQAGNLWYIVLYDGSAEIVKYTGKDQDLIIPAKINGLTVSSIGISAFYDCDTLTNIVIPNSVTQISQGSFSFCDSLTSITIPNGVTEIEVGTFQGCISLTSVTIPDSVTIIRGDAFDRCTSLTNVTIPSSVTTIESFAFDDCTALTSVIIPDSVTTISHSTSWSNGKFEWYPVFDGCPNLTLTVTPFSEAERFATYCDIPYVYTPSAEGWTCPSCMNYNEGKFCTECGTKQPEPTATPVPTPVDDGSWDCTCGSHNFGKFCGNCGTKKPEPNACPNCGHVTEGAATLFCTECGEKFE